MPSPRFHAAIFDMDGLLIDSERPIRDAWLQVARELGAPLEEHDYLQVVGRGEADTRRLLQERLGPRVSYDTARERVGVMLAQRQLTQGFAVKAGVIALLQQLHERGIPCSMASTASGRAGEVDAWSR